MGLGLGLAHLRAGPEDSSARDRAPTEGAVCAWVGGDPAWAVWSASAAHDEADETGDDADGEGGAGEDEGHSAHFGEEAGAR